MIEDCFFCRSYQVLRRRNRSDLLSPGLGALAVFFVLGRVALVVVFDLDRAALVVVLKFILAVA